MHSDDFEVQLVVGDVKQHLVNRGTRLKEQPPPTRQPAPPAAAPPVTPPPVPPAPKPVAAPPPIPPAAAAPRPAVPHINIPPRSASPQPPPLPGPHATGQQAPVPPPPPAVPPTPVAPAAISPKAPPPIQSQPSKPQPQPPQPPSRPPSQPPSPPMNWKRALLLGALMGAVIVVALIVVLVNQARKRNAIEKQRELAAVQVDVATTPSNASVRVNGEQKCTSPCQVSLAPGSYQIMAFLDGYDPATSALNVASGQPAVVNLTLSPQPQTVRILTDLDSGTVAYDDQPPAELQEGQFVLENVTPGPHTVKVCGQIRRRHVRFRHRRSETSRDHRRGDGQESGRRAGFESRQPGARGDQFRSDEAFRQRAAGSRRLARRRRSARFSAGRGRDYRR